MKISHLLSCLSILIISLLFSEAQVINGGSISPLPLYTFSWNITEDSLEVEIQLAALAWVGFGLHTAGSNDDAMINADIYTASFNSTDDITVDDRWSTEFDYPSTDLELNNSCTYDIETSTISGLQGTATTVVRFSRKLNTGDANCDVVVTNATQLLIFAYGTSNEFDYHYGNASQLYINLFTGEIPDTTTGGSTGEPSSSGGDDSSMTTAEVIVIVVGIIGVSLAIAQIIAAVLLRRRRGTRGSNMSSSSDFGYQAINEKVQEIGK